MNEIGRENEKRMFSNSQYSPEMAPLGDQKIAGEASLFRETDSGVHVREKRIAAEPVRKPPRTFDFFMENNNVKDGRRSKKIISSEQSFVIDSGVKQTFVFFTAFTELTKRRYVEPISTCEFSEVFNRIFSTNVIIWLFHLFGLS
jgi:hypothetical protein